jgi:hypothetical protein
MDRIHALNTYTVEWTRVHLLLNHFPVILAVMGALAIVLAMIRGQRAIWLYATVSFTLAALTIIPTYFTGQLAGRAPIWPSAGALDMVHAHEGAAKIAGVLVLLAGVVALFAWRRLVRYPREVRMPGSLRAALIITSLTAATSIGYVWWLGERIMHDAPTSWGGPAMMRYGPPAVRIAPPSAAPTSPAVVPADSTRLPALAPVGPSTAPSRPQP